MNFRRKIIIMMTSDSNIEILTFSGHNFKIELIANFNSLYFETVLLHEFCLI